GTAPNTTFTRGSCCCRWCCLDCATRSWCAPPWFWGCRFCGTRWVRPAGYFGWSRGSPVFAASSCRCTDGSCRRSVWHCWPGRGEGGGGGRGGGVGVRGGGRGRGGGGGGRVGGVGRGWGEASGGSAARRGGAWATPCRS